MANIIITHKSKIPLVSGGDNILVDRPFYATLDFSYSGSYNAANVDIDSSTNSYWHSWNNTNTISKLDTSGSLVSSTSSSLDVVGFDFLNFDGTNYYLTGLNGALGPMWIAKYDNNFNQLWSATYSSSYVSGSAISNVVDSSGNVYVAGGRVTGASGTYSVRKYNSSGTLQWSYDTGTSVNGICIDSNYLYLAIGSQIRIINFSAGSASTYTCADTIFWIDVDNQGNIYTDERSAGGSYIRKTSSAGTSLWRTKVRNSFTSSPQVNMTVDRVKGICYTATGSPTGNSSIGVALLGTDGNILGFIDKTVSCYGLKFVGNNLYVSADTVWKKYSITYNF